MDGGGDAGLSVFFEFHLNRKSQPALPVNTDRIFFLLYLASFLFRNDRIPENVIIGPVALKEVLRRDKKRHVRLIEEKTQFIRGTCIFSKLWDYIRSLLIFKKVVDRLRLQGGVTITTSNF